ncbi:hypothetical protein [Duganella qianjiadongensis]|uniref:Uncharacterized protein n=1 Tax=Duganella qianjiadongensis TaxID=2692176 RepID=A0ABW9VJG7_9BURK|nr:hypothetical protein [Duganella qianjiadongensis]MYM39749.1 hypothetical protein [Duganella qianjiadongensis]
MPIISIRNNADNAILKLQEKIPDNSSSLHTIFGREYAVAKAAGVFRVRRVMPSSLFKRAWTALADRCERKQESILTSRAQYFENMLNRRPTLALSNTQLKEKYPNLSDQHLDQFAKAGLSPQRLDQLLANAYGNVYQLLDLIKPVDSKFTPEEIQYVTETDGKIGSIYFAQGRIRLAHRDGPEVEILPPKSGRYTISKYDFGKFRKWYKKQREKQRDLDNPQITQFFKTKCSSLKPAAIGGPQLLEIKGPDGIYGVHPSRGGPKKFGLELDQIDINILCNAARTKDNFAMVVGLGVAGLDIPMSVF